MKLKCPVDYDLNNCSSNDYGLTCETCFHSYNHKYNSPDHSHITCKEFGKIDGMNGSCHYCLEDTPYQWEMCSDESWKRNLMSIRSKCQCTEEEAIEFINDYKSKLYQLN